jgi:hypothetical protein
MTKRAALITRLGILPEQRIPGVLLADPAGIACLFRSHDRIWFW